MSNNPLSTLKNTYDGQRIFNSREDGYSFDLLSDTWELDYKKYLYVAWTKGLDIETFLDLRLAIAHAAKHYAFQSLYSHVSTLKTIVEHLNIYEFQAWWLTLNSSYKKSVRDCLYALCHVRNGHTCRTLQPLYDSIKEEQLTRKQMIKGILDPKTGAYSETEHDNILESLRVATQEALNGELSSYNKFTYAKSVIASHLLLALVRRPVQLVQIKWCDVLPVGQLFESHNAKNLNWELVIQHVFSDVEQLHIRIFKGKDGQFRRNAESRSCRLEVNLSQSLLRYYQGYENYLLHSLSKQNISLNDEEIKEVMRRLPVFPHQSLFSSQFESKAELLCSISDTSKAYHMKPVNLRNNIVYLFDKKLTPSSDRLPNDTLRLGNNRWRHTILTQGAKHGLTSAHLAAITGVTIAAITPYLDLKISERAKIDEAYAGNNIIERFDSISVKELQTHDDFKVKSMFDEEIGHKINPANCLSCQSKCGAPMACYPCENFRPLETANHQQYLDKAERKLAINSQSAHPATVKKLKKIILYIKMTITLCEERKVAKVGGDT